MQQSIFLVAYSEDEQKRGMSRRVRQNGRDRDARCVLAGERII